MHALEWRQRLNFNFAPKFVCTLLQFLNLNCPNQQIINQHSVDIRIAFGYKDTRPTLFVGDRYERLYLIQFLTRPCKQAKNNICGFIRDDQDGDSFNRIFSLSKTNNLNVRIKLTPSSVGPNDDLNRQNPYQNVQSLISENNLLSGLNSAFATFYIGHSRDGGGPDFSPPKMSATKDVDFNWYRSNKPGINKVLAAMGSSQFKQNQIFGMLSCLSSKHFEKSISELSPRVRFVSTSKLIYYTEALDQSLREVSKAIREQLVAAASGASSP